MKWVLRIIAVLVIFVGVALALLLLIPSDRIAKLAAEQVSEATGREVRIFGQVRPSVWPALGVSTGEIEIDGNDGAVMLRANSMAVGVDLAGLVSGDIRIRGIEIDRPDVSLKLGPDGRGNWEADATETTESSDELREFSLDRLVIRNGKFSFRDKAGTATSLSKINLDASLPDFAGPVTAAFELAYLGVPVEGRLVAQSARTLLSGERTPVELVSNAGVNAVEFAGNLSLEGIIDGDFLANFPDPSFLPQLAGLPAGLGSDDVQAKGGLAFADGGLALAGLDITLDQNRITGDADVTFAEARPILRADLNLGAFDLAAVDTPADDGNVRTGWPKDPIDVSFLGAVDGRIDVRADSLALGTARLGPTVLSTVIDDRRSVTSIERMSAYDGAVGGEVILNGRNGFSTRVDVAGSALAISRLLSELIGYDRLIAAGDMELNVLGSGPHLDAVMNSLNGDGSLDVGAGELIGLDIVGMLRNLDPSFVGDTRRTIFDEIKVNFRVADGVVIYEDLSVTAPLFRAAGIGQIGLGGQTLDMRIMPELLGGERSGIRVPLTIKGTWDAPRIGLDVENLVRQGIESEVGQRLQDQAADRLGVTVEEGQSVEDAVRDRLEDEVRRGLGGLLGR